MSVRATPGTSTRAKRTMQLSTFNFLWHAEYQPAIGVMKPYVTQ